MVVMDLRCCPGELQKKCIGLHGRSLCLCEGLGYSVFRLCGHVAGSSRGAVIDAFNNEGPERKAFLLSKVGGGAGINLQTASMMSAWPAQSMPCVSAVCGKFMGGSYLLESRRNSCLAAIQTGKGECWWGPKPIQERWPRSFSPCIWMWVESNNPVAPEPEHVPLPHGLLPRKRSREHDFSLDSSGKLVCSAPDLRCSKKNRYLYKPGGKRSACPGH